MLAYLGSLNEVWMIGEAKVVVRAEVEHFTSPSLNLDSSRLSRGDHTLSLVCSSVFDSLQFLVDDVSEAVVCCGQASHTSGTRGGTKGLERREGTTSPHHRFTGKSSQSKEEKEGRGKEKWLCSASMTRRCGWERRL